MSEEGRIGVWARYASWVIPVAAFVSILMLSMAVAATPAEAACTVPNAISNGQTADATAVMDNFNALSNCVNSVVQASGTPTAGNLSVFSSPTGITGGNLSGDCTTNGTLAVTCTKTNANPFGYFATGTDAGQLTGTVSVNRFGSGLNADSSHFLRGDGVWAIPPGGGSGGANWWFKPPAAASFTLISGDATLPTLTDDADEGLIVDMNATAGVERGGYITLADKSANWTLTVRLDVFMLADPAHVGIWGRDSISGRCLFLVFTNTVGMEWSRMNSFTSYDSDIFAKWWALRPPSWLRITHSLGNYTPYISYNGKQWISLPSISDTSWTSNRIDQLGFEAGTSAGGVGLTIQYWNLSVDGA